MDIEEFLSINNPPRGDTYILYCGKNFLDDLKELERKYATTRS